MCERCKERVPPAFSRSGDLWRRSGPCATLKVRKKRWCAVGEDVEQTSFTREDRAKYRHKIRRSLDVFATMLRESRFDFERPLTGMEIELNLIDEAADPAMRNADVLNAIADPDFQTELGQFNIEINVPPRRLAGDE